MPIPYLLFIFKFDSIIVFLIRGQFRDFPFLKGLQASMVFYRNPTKEFFVTNILRNSGLDYVDS